MRVPKILAKFKLGTEKEDYTSVIQTIKTGVVFRGTNLWILIFAIFVASLGLNVNSTAVIIGAMLISPLMGPIMGIGLGIGINDFSLFRLAFHNYLVATLVALTTSTVFFLVSPLNDAHSEILARTQPTIYDVLIALVGGLAGILATSSKMKGNVITGVAIATALMPPLCTAGYGLATAQLSFFLGAIYLYIINTVFIALATFILVRLLEFPQHKLGTPQKERRARRIGWLIILCTLLPSIYFGYDIVQQNKFIKKANHFINGEAHFPNDYLLNKKIDPKTSTISLVFGGQEISAAEISQLDAKLSQYGLGTAKLEIRQGFAYLASGNTGNQSEQFNQLSASLEIREQQLKPLRHLADSLQEQNNLHKQVYAELKAQYPAIRSAIITPAPKFLDSMKFQHSYMVLLDMSVLPNLTDQRRLEQWLQIRLRQDTVLLVIQKR